MDIHAELLFELLCDKYEIQCIGHIQEDLQLQLPVFYKQDMLLEKGGVYITNSQNIPTYIYESCLFICAGNAPALSCRDCIGAVLRILDANIDVITLMNAVQSILQRVFTWEKSMEDILGRNGSINELVETSIHVINNRICVTDYEFRILGHCGIYDSDDRRNIVMQPDMNWIPADVTAAFAQEYVKTKQKREPFYIRTKERNNIWDNYCINMFLSDEYIGTCAVSEDRKPFSKSELLLFHRFAEYVRSAMITQSKQVTSTFVSMKTIFSELLQNLPVSQSNLEQAMKPIKHNAAYWIRENLWICSVIQSANRKKILPEEYLCSTLEEILPNSISLVHEDSIVVFTMTAPEHTCGETISSTLTPFMKDMNFQAGISYPFSDVFKARSYYMQARKVLEIGFDHEWGVKLFSSCVLDYMLMEASSSFTPEMLMPPGLLALRTVGNNVDYWDTLRTYLDYECNASKAAEAMYLHRSTLLPRLEKIKKYVDFDTPEQRLLLRICMRAYDLTHSSES